MLNKELENFHKQLQESKVAVIGLGVSNIPLIKYLKNLNVDVTVFDNRTVEQMPEEILQILEKIRSKKLTNFDFDRYLYDAINEFHALKERYPKLQEKKEFIKTEINIIESESEIVGLRKYYNDIVTDYNKMIKKFPTNVVANILKYKERPFYDLKDMTDEDYEDFKL